MGEAETIPAHPTVVPRHVRSVSGGMRSYRAGRAKRTWGNIAYNVQGTRSSTYHSWLPHFRGICLALP